MVRWGESPTRPFNARHFMLAGVSVYETSITGRLAQSENF